MIFTHPNIFFGQPFSLDILHGNLSYGLYGVGSNRLLLMYGVKDAQAVDATQLRFQNVETVEETEFLLGLKRSLFETACCFIDIHDNRPGYLFKKGIIKEREDFSGMAYMEPQDIAERIMFYDFLLEEAHELDMPMYKIETFHGKARISTLSRDWNRLFDTVSECTRVFNEIQERK